MNLGYGLTNLGKAIRNYTASIATRIIEARDNYTIGLAQRQKRRLESQLFPFIVGGSGICPADPKNRSYEIKFNRGMRRRYDRMMKRWLRTIRTLEKLTGGEQV